MNATFVQQLHDVRERDRSDGSIRVYPQVRVRYDDGRERDLGEAFVRPVR